MRVQFLLGVQGLFRAVVAAYTLISTVLKCTEHPRIFRFIDEVIGGNGEDTVRQPLWNWHGDDCGRGGGFRDIQR